MTLPAPGIAAAAAASAARVVSNVPSVFIPPAYINPPAHSHESQPQHLPEQLGAEQQELAALSAVTLVRVPHMHSGANEPELLLPIRAFDARFALHASYLWRRELCSCTGDGNGSSCVPDYGDESKRFPPLPHRGLVLYLNPSQVAWYEQQLAAPRLRVWILIKNTSFVLNTANNVGYVKRRLVETALRNNVQLTLMNPYQFDLAVSVRQAGTLVYNSKPVQLPDAVIPRVGANVDYLGLAVLRQLEASGVLVFNPVNSIEISRDKLYTHQILASHGVPIPKTMLSRYPIEYEHIEAQFSYPLVVKLASGSRGEAVWLCESRARLQELLESDVVDRSKPLIVQEFLHSTKGRDLRLLVVGDRVVASCMRISSSSFKANFHAGGSVLPVDIEPALARMAVRAAQLCGLTFSGVDILMGADGYCVCEVNSSPGFEGLEKATQIDCAQAMIDHVIEAVARRAPLSLASNSARELFPLQEDHLRIIREMREKERLYHSEFEAAAGARAVAIP